MRQKEKGCNHYQGTKHSFKITAKKKEARNEVPQLEKKIAPVRIHW